MIAFTHSTIKPLFHRIYGCATTVINLLYYETLILSIKCGRMKRRERMRMPADAVETAPGVNLSHGS